jgi:hypothetical protein
MHIHTYTYAYRHTYTLLDIEAGDAPQRVLHDMSAIQGLPLPFIQSWYACSRRFPNTAISVEEPFRVFFDGEKPVSSAQNLQLLRVSVLRGMSSRIIQLAFRTVAEFA